MKRRDFLRQASSGALAAMLAGGVEAASGTQATAKPAPAAPPSSGGASRPNILITDQTRAS